MFLPSFGGSPSWLKPGFQLAISIDPNFFANYYSYSYIRFSYTGMPGGASGTMLQVILATSAISLLLSIVTLLLVAVVTAIITKRNWQERPPHPFAVWFKHRLCTPVVMLDLLQRWMKRKLERNPIGWLEQRTWSGRLVIWGWFAVMISVYSLVLTDANFLTRNLTATHVLMGWMLLISMAVNASTSFRRERENRVLELLLVSPLNESQIILGRLRGLWDQFLPSMVLLLGGWVYLSTSLQHHEDGSTIIFFATSFLTVPIIGLYFSLTCRNFLTALIATIIVAMILPVIWNSTFTFILRLLSIGLIQIDADALALIFHPGLIQLALAAWLGWWMHRRLVHRRFATEST